MDFLTSAQDHDAHSTGDARPRSTLIAFTGEFIIGMALARGFHPDASVLSGARCTAIVISGVAVILGVIWLYPVKASFELPLNALFFFWIFIPILGLMLLAMANGRGRLCGFLAYPPIVLLGEASFAMYILHEPILRI